MTTEYRESANPRDGNTTAAKHRLRTQVLARRRRIDEESRTRDGRRLRDAAWACALFDDVSTVAAFVSMGTEVPTLPLLQSLLKRNIRLLVPRMGTGSDVRWGELTDIRRLCNRGAGRPDEPDGPPLDADALAAADVVITAGLLVDRHGTRLGRGGGWYDRALRHAKTNAVTATVVWPWEVVEGPLPSEPHDMRVDAALTPDGLVRFTRSGNDGRAAAPGCRLARI